MSAKVTVPSLLAKKNRGEKIVCVTAYDSIFGSLADLSGADLVLVGDSVSTTVMGHATTLPVNLEEMVHHTRAVAKGVSRALLVGDLPFGSYQSSVSQAVDSAVALVKAGAEAVKLEGGYFEQIAAIARAGIPVMGHVGMTPQSVHRFGGPKVQGKGALGDEVLDVTQGVCEAGAFGVVLELIPAELGKRISESVSCVTIGIGAGPDCHGEIQVLYDILGFSERAYKHSKSYLDGRSLVLESLKRYAEEVRAGQFPTHENAS